MSMLACAAVLLAAPPAEPFVAPPLLPAGETYSEAVPTPQDVLGFDVGDRHLRHDQLAFYLRTLAKASDRVRLDAYARSHGARPLFVLTITGAKNRANLAALPAARRRLADPGAEAPNPDTLPAVIWAGYGVHGDEPSASNAAALVAYHLAASTSDQTARILDRCVVLLDPCMNPDGFDRFAHWANTYRGRVPNPDPDHKEHNQSFPSGRTNGYWFDLNRDWLPGVHPESRGRLSLYYQWRPNVVLDYHEMGTDATYF
ncbi:MAG: M14 family zinc carboxypeptidase, partial [Planctomycetota bacterium]